MDPPNCRSWNTIIRALSESDDPFQALVLFRLMLVDELVEPNRFTFPSVLKACAQTGRVEEGKQVHGMEYAHVLFNSNKVNVERKTQMGEKCVVVELDDFWVCTEWTVFEAKLERVDAGGPVADEHLVDELHELLRAVKVGLVVEIEHWDAGPKTRVARREDGCGDSVFGG
ncbi:hypothetical protein RJ640_014384 [Escallonia rubra]|uniref:Pentatricopeptide repeat-containing protein n=1 Tax=Escallonia rubra TaxID=112253 RepID=A0AA88R3W9_9ASTE|nr:hypothetical protein RJ640_014384 [Escallonia rubra]